MMGTSPLAIPTSFESTKFPTIDERLQQLSKDRQEALAAHEIARSRMAERIKSNYKPFRVGQKVWLTTKNLKMNISPKFKPKAEGPFTIIKQLGYLTYQLELPKTWKIHNNFHAVMLKPYIENETYGVHFNRPPPDIVNEEEEYEVEKILSSRRRGNSYKYLIKWKGYPSSDNSWEPEANLANSREKLNEYQRRRKLPISTLDDEPLPPTRQPRTQRRVRRQIRTIQWSTPRRPIPANGGRTPTIRSNTTLDRSDWTKYSARSSRDAYDSRTQTPDAFHWTRQTNTNDISPSTSRSAIRANPFRTKTAPKAPAH